MKKGEKPEENYVAIKFASVSLSLGCGLYFCSFEKRQLYNKCELKIRLINN